MNSPGGLFQQMMGSGLDAARQAAYASNAAMQGAVEQTVATAYTVIDQYMNRGYDAASLRHRTNGDRPMNDQSKHDPRGAPPLGMGGPWGAGNPLMESWIQMMRLWSTSMMGFAGPAGQDWMGQMAGWGMAAPTQVSVQVASKRATLVTVELRPGADRQRLEVGPAKHIDDPATAVLEGVEIDGTPWQVTVRVKVADKQPAGRYVAPIRDDRGYECGHVHLDITDAPPKSPKKKK